MSNKHPYRTNKWRESLELILIEAYKLFLTREYVDVTTIDLEEVTGLSRGSIYYKTKNKEGLYRAVIDKFVFGFLESDNCIELQDPHPRTFALFLESECNRIESRMDSMHSLLGENDISPKYINLFFGACFHYNGFQERFKEYNTAEMERWRKHILIGIEIGELKKGLDIETTIKSFRSMYYGDSFLQSILGEELIVRDLRTKWENLYHTIIL